MLTVHQQRETPNYKLGAPPGECGVNDHTDKKTEQNPDSWTRELFLLTGWDLALAVTTTIGSGLEGEGGALKKKYYKTF